MLSKAIRPNKNLISLTMVSIRVVRVAQIILTYTF